MNYENINNSNFDGMPLASFCQSRAEQLALSDEIKICYIFKVQSNENQAFLFFGTPDLINSQL